MFTKDKKGVIRGPFVQKHWRQDWTYEDKNILVFEGDKKWINKNQIIDAIKFYGNCEYSVYLKKLIS